MIFDMSGCYFVWLFFFSFILFYAEAKEMMGLTKTNIDNCTHILNLKKKNDVAGHVFILFLLSNRHNKIKSRVISCWFHSFV